MIVNVLILISQASNVFIGGDPDEMLCSRAWRLRKEVYFWRCVQMFFDYYCWPLSQWTGGYNTHCQACYHEERKRLQERIRDYE